MFRRTKLVCRNGNNTAEVLAFIFCYFVGSQIRDTTSSGKCLRIGFTLSRLRFKVHVKAAGFR